MPLEWEESVWEIAPMTILSLQGFSPGFITIARGQFGHKIKICDKTSVTAIKGSFGLL